MESENELLLTEGVTKRHISALERAYVAISAALNLGSTGLGAITIARGLEIGNVPLSALGVCVAWWNGETLLSMSRHFEEHYPREID